MRNKSEKIFRSICYTLTIVWVLLVLFPTYWLIISSVKDQVTAYKSPPEFLPSLPTEVLVKLNYDGDIQNNSKSMQEAFYKDSTIITWLLFDKYKDIQLGRVKVVAVANENVEYSAVLKLRDFKLNRPKIWYSFSLKEEQIIGKLDDATKVLNIKTVNYKDKEQSSYKYEYEIRKFLSSKALITGKIFSIAGYNSFASLIDNYIVALKAPSLLNSSASYGKTAQNSIFVSVMGILAQLTFSSMAAYCISKVLKGKISHVMLLFFIATLMIPGVLAILPLFLIMDRMGLMNTLWAVILPAIPNAFYIYLLKGFFDALPAEMFESGVIDGASDFKLYTSLALPLSYPALGIVAMFTFITSWNDFYWPYLVLQSRENWTLNILVYTNTNTAAGVSSLIDYPVVLAMALIASIPTLIIFAVFQKQLQKGMIWGGLKG